MKKIVLAILLLVQYVCYAQKGVEPIRIEMNENKYLFIKFPSEISYADMGSYDLMAEKSLNQILKLKATTPNFEKTNLSVVTTDGKYYSFIVAYNPKPAYIAVDMAEVKDRIASTGIIASTPIEISDIHTTHIILPSKVADIAMGSDVIISEKAETIDNIVKVKSVVDEKGRFPETSITVVAIDGKIYPMTVGYAKNPKDMSISFSEGIKAMFGDVNVNDDNMRKMSEWIVGKGSRINDLGCVEGKMMLQLSGVYTDQDIIAFCLRARNNSQMDYPIDFVKAYISQKNDKKYTSQDEELYPIYSYFSNGQKKINGKESMSIVLFYKKFTITKDRILNFEMYEDNGGRNLKFPVGNKVIIDAEVIGEIK